MIILHKLDKKDPFTWWWSCEHCGATKDGFAPAGIIPEHADWCPDPTWEKKLSWWQRRSFVPEFFCRWTFVVCVAMNWHMPEYYFRSLLFAERRKTLERLKEVTEHDRHKQ